MPYKRKDNCVYKETGAKVGCSKNAAGAEKYMKALYAAEMKESFNSKMRIRIKEVEDFTPIQKDPIPSTSNKQFQIAGSIITNTKVKPQTDILSAIRSLPGVTIVNSQATVPGSNTDGQLRYQANIDVKIDTHAIEGDVKTAIKKIIDDVKKIDGVVEFKVSPKATVTKPY